MTNEEYKKELTRYWDSIRDKDIDMMGDCNCGGVECDKCMFSKPCPSSFPYCYSNAFEAVKLIEQWSKEHPIKTNGQVAKELLEEKFGIKFLYFYGCEKINCDKVKNHEDCDECEFKRFWDEEYKEVRE